MPKTEIKAGQIWRDKDKRRRKDGTVRNFRIEACGVLWIQCVLVGGVHKIYQFRADRFGRQSDSDSFEMVSE